VLTFRHVFAYDFFVPDDPRQKNALLIAASLIAAVRTARAKSRSSQPTQHRRKVNTSEKYVWPDWRIRHFIVSEFLFWDWCSFIV
jgi:hypothetical protein